MTAIDIIAFLLAFPFVLLLAIFSAEVAAGLRPLAAPSGHGSTPSTVVLIPAHDEAAGISATVASARAHGDPQIEVLVVADNCTDDTAERARLAGARVAERTDLIRRGKGFALAFGRDVLAATPPACVVVLDADCVVEGRGVPALARSAVATNRAVQARNLQRPDHAASAAAQISNFAFLVKNLVRQRGMARLGGVAALTGTGMALPWRQFAEAPLANADLAEDLALGTWLTLAGHPPILDESVHIWSKAETGTSLLVQRSRWERGFLAIARRHALPLIGKGVADRSRNLLWLGLHLIVPPLALLFASAGTILVTTTLLIALGASIFPPLFVAASMVIAGLATIRAWHAEGKEWIAGTTLLRIPLYVAAKLPFYRGLLLRGDKATWIRTRRSSDSERP